MTFSNLTPQQTLLKDHVIPKRSEAEVRGKMNASESGRFDPDPQWAHSCQNCGWDRDEHAGSERWCPRKCPVCGEHLTIDHHLSCTP